MVRAPWGLQPCTRPSLGWTKCSIRSCIELYPPDALVVYSNIFALPNHPWAWAEAVDNLTPMGRDEFEQGVKNLEGQNISQADMLLLSLNTWKILRLLISQW